MFLPDPSNINVLKCVFANQMTVLKTTNKHGGISIKIITFFLKDKTTEIKLLWPFNSCYFWWDNSYCKDGIIKSNPINKGHEILLIPRLLWFAMRFNLKYDVPGASDGHFTYCCCRCFYHQIAAIWCPSFGLKVSIAYVTFNCHTPARL